MKIIRAIIIFAAITFFVNGNFSNNEQSVINTLNTEQKEEGQKDLDDLVNAFDNAIQKGEVEIFYKELNAAENTHKN